MARKPTRKEANMDNLHLLGCASALFDNLALSWQDCPSLEISRLDSLDLAIERIYARRPDWVVYCGRAAQSSWEATPASFADDLSQFERLTLAAAETGAHLLLISSDRVTAGPRMFHDETEPAASDLQAQQLHAVEQAAMTIDADRRRLLVVRTNAIGWSTSGDSFAERIWRSLEAREPLELDSVSYATPILASDLAELLLRCFRVKPRGLIHMGGAERTSPFRFAQELARAAGFDYRLVRAAVPEMADGEPVLSHCETSLASRLVRRELEVSLPLLRESVSRFVEQATNGYRERLGNIVPPTCVKAA
jgi:dTDP-4-dehydrorhamnose reductase